MLPRNSNTIGGGAISPLYFHRCFFYPFSWENYSCHFSVGIDNAKSERYMSENSVWTPREIVSDILGIDDDYNRLWERRIREIARALYGKLNGGRWMFETSQVTEILNQLTNPPRMWGRKVTIEVELEFMTIGYCSCGAPIPCTAPKFGGNHVPQEIWDDLND